MSESNIQKQIMLALSHAGVTAWRNNTAQAWVGEAVRITATRQVLLHPGDVVVRNARPLHAGLCAGSSDLIGLHHGSGKFVAVEVKSPTGRATTQQTNFIDHVRSHGGLAGIARSPGDALNIIKQHDNSP
jgi:hypothetical protein